MSALKVYGVTVTLRGNAGFKQVRAIVAATSISKAAAALRITPNRLRTYGSVTGNATELEVALADPGVVYFNPDEHRGAPYQQWEPEA